VKNYLHIKIIERSSPNSELDPVTTVCTFPIYTRILTLIGNQDRDKISFFTLWTGGIWAADWNWHISHDIRNLCSFC